MLVNGRSRRWLAAVLVTCGAGPASVALSAGAPGAHARSLRPWATSGCHTCGPFDACGLAGTVTLTPGAVGHSTVFLSGNAPLHRPARDLTAALHGTAEPGIRLEGGGIADVRGAVSAALTQGPTTCTDSVGLRQFTVGLATRGRRLGVSLSPVASQAADPLRTRCPGPDLGRHVLTVAQVPLSTLARRSFTVDLAGRAFRDGPYRVTTRSTLAITLRRTRTQTRIVRIYSAG